MDGPSPVKAEESAADRKSGYKSWKKKYRKMRIVFDQKMQEGEDLHKQEAKASATVKRLAVENDRLLDLLLEINNSAQIPLDKRIDVSMKPSSNAKAPALTLDRPPNQQKELALKKLEQLLEDIPHTSYGSAKKSKPSYINDLSALDGELYPASFLSADDVDNYIHEIDSSIDADTHIPTLAPRAHPNSQPISHPHLKNPTSVTNWLRKHAPKIFLQDGEAHGGGDGDDNEGGTNGHHTGGRKTRGSRGERGGGRGRGKRGSLSSRLSAVAAADRERDRSGADWDASMDEDPDFGSTPVGRGKRKRTDDLGYRPGGSAGRPVKKKRKSDADGTPSARKSKKEAAAAAAAAATPSKDE